jgi:ComF family protein
MLIPEGIKNLYRQILDLVFPVACLVCGADNLFLCARCEDRLPRLENQLCIACYKPAPFGKTHPICRTRNTVDGVISALPYKHLAVRKIIETFKYNFISDLSAPLARKIVLEIRNQELDGYFNNYVIIPVPLHNRRFNWRGFNQAQLLSQALSLELNAPVDENLVKRSKFTQPQTTLTADERQKNITGAFEAIGDISGKKIIIVDDVVTSGATLNEIAKLLKRHGALEVWGLTAAHG